MFETCLGADRFFLPPAHTCFVESWDPAWGLSYVSASRRDHNVAVFRLWLEEGLGPPRPLAPGMARRGLVGGTELASCSYDCWSTRLLRGGRFRCAVVGSTGNYHQQT